MNNLGIDLTGKTAIYSARSFYKKDAPVEERSFVCLSGRGCDPTPGTGRKVYVRWPDGVEEDIDSHVIEAVLENGVWINPLPEETSAEVHIAEVKKEKPRQVKRKR